MSSFTVTAPYAPSPKAPKALWDAYYSRYALYVAASLRLAEQSVLAARVRAAKPAKPKGSSGVKPNSPVVPARKTKAVSPTAPKVSEAGKPAKKASEAVKTADAKDKAPKAPKNAVSTASAGPSSSGAGPSRQPRPVTPSFWRRTATSDDSLPDQFSESDTDPENDSDAEPAAPLPRGTRSGWFRGDEAAGDQPLRAFARGKEIRLAASHDAVPQSIFPPPRVTPGKKGKEVSRPTPAATQSAKLRKPRPGKAERSRAKLVKANPAPKAPVVTRSCGNCQLPLPLTRRQLVAALGDTIDPLVGEPGYYVHACALAVRRLRSPEEAARFAEVKPDEAVIPFPYPGE